MMYHLLIWGQCSDVVRQKVLESNDNYKGTAHTSDGGICLIAQRAWQHHHDGYSHYWSSCIVTDDRPATPKEDITCTV